MNTVIELSKQLINIPSVTPNGTECIDVLVPLLEKLGFTIERFPCGEADNLWARRGNTSPLVCFLGHVDVVPPGPEEKWKHSPFVATLDNGYLYGRGASDMKTGVAAFIVAIEQFIQQNPETDGSIAVLITTAEEELDELGVPNVIEVLEARGEKIDFCITAEPSSSDVLGDTLRCGRRGSLSAKLTIKGTQGHIAYPHLADNPIHKIFAAFADLTSEQWCQGNQYFPVTSFQFSNIHAGTGAGNVIPGELVADINFRFSPEVNANELQQKTEEILKRHQLEYSIQWKLSGKPFLTREGTLTNAAIAAVETVLHVTPQLSTAGGTSDARFIAPTGAEVIELGVSNKTAHKIDECVSIEDLKKLPSVFLKILENLLTK